MKITKLITLILFLQFSLHCEEVYQDALHEMESTFAQQMKNEYQLNWKGSSGRLHDQIEEIGMEFAADRRATLDEARALGQQVISKFIETIKIDKKIQPYLAKRPSELASVSISFDGPNGRNSDGSVSNLFNVVDNYSNQIFYFSHDPFEDRLIKELEEPFVELTPEDSNHKLSIHQPNAYEEEMDRLFVDLTNEVFNRYGLKRWSIGGKLTNGIREIGATFKIYQPMTQDQARQLLIELTDQLLSKLNSNEKIKPFLKQFPFPVDFLKIKIFSEQREGTSFPDVFIENVILEDNRIYFLQKTLLPKEEDKFFRDSEHISLPSESYSDAREIVNSQPQKLKKNSTFLQYLKEMFYSFF